MNSRGAAIGGRKTEWERGARTPKVINKGRLLIDNSADSLDRLREMLMASWRRLLTDEWGRKRQMRHSVCPFFVFRV